MFKYTANVVLGILIILVPFSGFPRSWRTCLLVIFGLAIVLLSYLARREKRLLSPVGISNEWPKKPQFSPMNTFTNAEEDGQFKESLPSVKSFAEKYGLREIHMNEISATTAAASPRPKSSSQKKPLFYSVYEMNSADVDEEAVVNTDDILAESLPAIPIMSNIVEQDEIIIEIQPEKSVAPKRKRAVRGVPVRKGVPTPAKPSRKKKPAEKKLHVVSESPHEN
jgi:hypothetical protein